MPGTLLKTGIKYFLIALPAFCLPEGCESFKQVDACDFETEAVSGFTKTNTEGVIQETDKDDWRISPKYSIYVSVTPAFPNPARSRSISLNINIFDLIGGQLSNIDIIAQDPKGNWVSLIPNIGRPKTTPDTGIWTLPVDFNRLTPEGGTPVTGLKRIYVVDSPLATDFCSSLISYGDILLSP